MTLPTGSLQNNGSDLPAGPRRQLTYREARYVAARLNGEDMLHAGRKAGFSEWLCRAAGNNIEVGAVEEALHEAQSILANHALANGLIDATEIHEYLTDAIRSDWTDIENNDGTFKPISEWPDIWRRMKEAGDIEVEYQSTRSHDGEDKDGLGGWDRDGIVKKVKIKFASRVKLIELAMRHKGVDAMVQQKQGDTNINITVTAQQQRIDRAKARVARVIEAEAKHVDD